MSRCAAAGSIRVLRVRIRDRHASALEEMARAVNMVWNYCNELSLKVLKRERRFIGAHEMQRYLNGASKEGLAVGSAVFQQVAEEYCTRRRQHRKRRLAWRRSGGSRCSLGWIPFKARSLTYGQGQVAFQGRRLGLWDSWALGNYEMGAGCFSQDARGRWYLNVCVRVQPKARTAPQVVEQAVGIDLGLKDFLATSDGQKVSAQRFYRDLESALARAQRASKKSRIRAIHAKIANRRRDSLHKLTTGLVSEHQAIFVGNVNAHALARGPHAKSVLDAGWSTFRTMLQYKCDDAGVWFQEADEAYSSQECSACGARTGPRGLEGLAVRVWACPVCSCEHDRDVNAARVIRARGMLWLHDQFAAALEARASEGAVNEAAPCAAAAGHGRPVVGIPRL